MALVLIGTWQWYCTTNTTRYHHKSTLIVLLPQSTWWYQRNSPRNTTCRRTKYHLVQSLLPMIPYYGTYCAACRNSVVCLPLALPRLSQRLHTALRDWRAGRRMAILDGPAIYIRYLCSLAGFQHFVLLLTPD